MSRRCCGAGIGPASVYLLVVLLGAASFVTRCHRRQHLAVASVGADELRVATAGRHPTTIDEHHGVGEIDRGRSVGDDDGGAILHHRAHGFTDLVLLARVDR